MERFLARPHRPAGASPRPSEKRGRTAFFTDDLPRKRYGPSVQRLNVDRRRRRRRGRAGWTPLDVAQRFWTAARPFCRCAPRRCDGAQFLDLAAAIVDAATPAGATVIVNDRADIARLAGAAGVHVGQDDLPPARVRAVVGDAAIVGLSTHTVEQIDRAVGEPITTSPSGRCSARSPRPPATTRSVCVVSAGGRRAQPTASRSWRSAASP